VLDLPDTSGYPRPLQEHVPIVLGGGGERRTLRLAARYADVANVLGDLPAVARKARVLQEHCAATGRTVVLSHLTTALVGADPAEVAGLVDALRPRGSDPATYAAQVHAGTVADHVGRYRELAEAGVAEVAVRLPDLRDPEPVARMGEVIAAFR
jgi:alkanesulfonate monooxygenase SsuD/methylene tetrahydromethanopterin reductase-like flavin-dependent oxidoreductase (luciferase family)